MRGARRRRQVHVCEEEMGREGTGPLPYPPLPPGLPCLPRLSPPHPPSSTPASSCLSFFPFSPLFSSLRLLSPAAPSLACCKNQNAPQTSSSVPKSGRTAGRTARRTMGRMWDVCGMCGTCGTCGWSGRVAWCEIVGIDNVWEEGIGKRIEYTGSRVQIELGELNGP